MNIVENISNIKKTIPENVTLVAISKTKNNKAIMEAYTSGQRIFGENRTSELAEKYKSLPKDIQWHMIGHLQSNKVKLIAPFISLIHSVDSTKLLEVINKEAQKVNRIIPCLLQVYIAQEKTKYGFLAEEVEAILASEAIYNLKHIKIIGLMGMATNTSNNELVRKEFQKLKTLFDKIKQTKNITTKEFTILSMGMSQDYLLAIKEGSTMIRVGSKIFGSRIETKNI